MSTVTQNLSLTKDDENDFYNVDRVNDNLDKLDIFAGGVKHSIEQPRITTLTFSCSINFLLEENNVFIVDLVGYMLNLTIVASAESGYFQSCIIQITQSNTAAAVIFSGTIKWDNDEIPDLSQTSKVYTLSFYTIDGGTTFVGQLINTHSA